MRSADGGRRRRAPAPRQIGFFQHRPAAARRRCGDRIGSPADDCRRFLTAVRLTPPSCCRVYSRMARRSTMCFRSGQSGQAPRIFQWFRPPRHPLRNRTGSKEYRVHMGFAGADSGRAGDTPRKSTGLLNRHFSFFSNLPSPLWNLRRRHWEWKNRPEAPRETG